MNKSKKKRRTRSDKGVKRGSRKVESIPYVAIDGPEAVETANAVIEEVSRLVSRPEGVVVEGNIEVEDIPPQMIVIDLPINRRLVLLKDEKGEVFNGDVRDNRVYRRGQFVQVRRQRDGRVLVVGGRALNRV